MDALRHRGPEPSEPTRPVHIFYVDGPAGTGKTYLFKKLDYACRALGKIAIAVAMSGIASLLMPRGRTAYSRFGLPVPVPLDGCVCNIKASSSRGSLLRNVSLILWDEAPTASRAVFDAVDQLLRDLRANHSWQQAERFFGGVVLVLAGDFRQIPPVLPRLSRERALEHNIVRTNWWQDDMVKRSYKLTTNMRAATDHRFASTSLAIGEGQVQDAQQRVELPADLAPPDQWTPTQLLKWTYEGLQLH